MISLSASVAGLVFLRAIQQLNVIHHMYLYAAITSYCIAIAEVSVIIGIVGAGWPSVPWVGTGGAIGVVSAMFLHRRIRRLTEPKTRP